ncbi:MAG: penicillin-binding protein activator [Candidatus Paceibacterota bacterium]
MNKKAVWSIVAVIIIILIIAGVRNSNQSADDGQIKIGVMFMLTGDGAAWGENAKKGADIAFEEYNAAHPDKPVAVIYGDTKTDAKEAVSVFNKLTSLDKVDFIVGPLFQHELAAIDPLIQKKGLPVIAPGYFSRENRTNLKNPLLMWLDAMIETDRIADYVIKQGFKTVSIINSADGWESSVGAEFEKKMKEAGVKVLAHETVQIDASDVRLPVTKILAGKPEAVFVATYMQYVNATKAIGEQQYKGKLFSIEIDEYLAGETKNFVSEMLAINPDRYQSGFSEKFEKRYGTKPGMPSGHAYDAVSLLLSSIAKDSDPKSVLEDFRTRTSYEGVSGLVEFTADGRTLFPTALYQIKGGVLNRVTALE